MVTLVDTCMCSCLTSMCDAPEFTSMVMLLCVFWPMCIANSSDVSWVRMSSLACVCPAVKIGFVGDGTGTSWIRRYGALTSSLSSSCWTIDANAMIRAFLLGSFLADVFFPARLLGLDHSTFALGLIAQWCSLGESNVLNIGLWKAVVLLVYYNWLWVTIMWK